MNILNRHSLGTCYNKTVSRFTVRRLVALPFDQVRAALERFRSRLPWRMVLLSVYVIVAFLGILVSVSMVMTGQNFERVGLLIDVPHSVNATNCLREAAPHVISVLRRGEYLFDGVPVGPSGIEPHLRKAIAASPVPVVYVEGGGDLRVEDVYATIDALKGIDPNLHVALLTPKMKSEHCLLFRFRSYP